MCGKYGHKAAACYERNSNQQKEKFWKYFLANRTGFKKFCMQEQFIWQGFTTWTWKYRMNDAISSIDIKNLPFWTAL